MVLENCMICLLPYQALTVATPHFMIYTLFVTAKLTMAFLTNDANINLAYDPLVLFLGVLLISECNISLA